MPTPPKINVQIAVDVANAMDALVSLVACFRFNSIKEGEEYLEKPVTGLLARVNKCRE